MHTTGTRALARTLLAACLPVVVAAVTGASSAQAATLEATYEITGGTAVFPAAVGDESILGGTVRFRIEATGPLASPVFGTASGSIRSLSVQTSGLTLALAAPVAALARPFVLGSGYLYNTASASGSTLAAPATLPSPVAFGFRSISLFFSLPSATLSGTLSAETPGGSFGFAGFVGREIERRFVPEPRPFAPALTAGAIALLSWAGRAGRRAGRSSRW